MYTNVNLAAPIGVLLFLGTALLIISDLTHAQVFTSPVLWMATLFRLRAATQNA
ncbi:MAG TPA: hypothetical protein VE056_09160 [Pyrinomonadaceae bacterium]|nr:hypothetical protein [Pyrinomonadaceae bacterium]